MPILEAHDLYKTFRSHKHTVPAVRGVTLDIAAGEVLAFLGPNGAGKTTCIKMVAGLVWPDQGWVRVAGRDPMHDARAMREIGAVLEGNRNIYWRLTPEENLVYFGVLRGMGQHEADVRALEMLARFQLMDKRRDTAQTLSRGMQQKLSIAVAYMHRPKLLLLDEPTLGLDVEAARSVKQLVREISAEGHAILLTTHQLDIAQEISDRVAIIRQGEIVAEAETRELIRRFSGHAFSIQVTGVPSSAQLSELAALGAHYAQEQICYTGDSDTLWRVLDVLKPLPLVRVAQDEADPTEIFLKLTREE